MNHPKGLAMDDRGNVYVADTMNMAIRKISDSGNLQVLMSALSYFAMDFFRGFNLSNSTSSIFPTPSSTKKVEMK